MAPSKPTKKAAKTSKAKRAPVGARTSRAAARPAEEITQPRAPRPPVPVDEVAQFNQDGLVVIENAFDPAFIALLRQAHEQVTAERNPHVNVGRARFMLSLELKGAFLDPRLYINPRVLPVIQGVLGKDCILDSVTSVVAMPGAAEQHVHKDGTILFDDATGGPLPCHALTLVVPLIDLDQSTGTTAMFAGTQRLPLTVHQPVSATLPYVKAGSCYLMDYRLTHFGTPNVSGKPRPILYLVFCRPWFVDFANFMETPPLRVERKDLDGLPGVVQWLFARPMISAGYAKTPPPA